MSPSSLTEGAVTNRLHVLGKRGGGEKEDTLTPQPSGEEAELVQGIAPPAKERRAPGWCGEYSHPQHHKPSKPAPLAAQDHCKPFQDPRGATEAASQGEKPTAGQRKPAHTLLLPKKPHFLTT